MNKNLQAGLAPIISIIVVVLIIIGGVFLSISKDSKKSSNEDGMENQTATAMDGVKNIDSDTPQATLRSLIDKGENVRCSISSSSDGISTEGIVYINEDGDLRGDFSSKSSQGSADSHLILKNDVAYVWSGEEGVRVAVNRADGITEQAVNLDLKFGYECGSWQRDDSMLDLPGIDFLDLDQMMMEAQQGQ